MLSLNLAKIRTPEGHFEQVYQPAELAGDTDVYSIVAPVALVFDIHKDKDRFRLVGRVVTTLEMSCSRCLDPFTVAVDAPFDLRYQPLAPNAVEGEREIEADDLDTASTRTTRSTSGS